MTFRPCGVMPAMVTPLTENETLDEAALRRLVKHLMAGRVHGLFVVGSQGEAYALTSQEKRRILEIVVEETLGRLPVYVGTGAVTTRETIALTLMAEQAGATAVSVITPYFITPSPGELYEHYVAVAKATHLPVLLYTNPSRTGVKLSSSLVAKLALVENIVGIKDSSGDLSLTCEYIRQTPSDFAVLAGRDTLIFATLMSGGAGAIAATANVVPGLVAKIYDAQKAGDYDAAREAQNRLAPLRLAFEMGTFPVVIKEALALMGICSARAKSPVGPITESKRIELKTILQQLQVL
jgi:4-hydroxy-tetrahydrodipicolinate synthase